MPNNCPIALKDHPFYIALNKRNAQGNSYTITFTQFTKHFSNFNQYQLTEDDQLTLIDITARYILSSLKNNLLRDSFTQKSIQELKFVPSHFDIEPPTTKFTYFLSVCEKLLLLDTSKKTIIWQPSSLAFIDQFALGRDILDTIEPDQITKSKHREICLQNLSKQIIAQSEALYYFNEDNLNRNLNYFQEQLTRYDKKPNWGVILKAQPALSNALLAYNYGYELNQKELLNVFENTYDVVRTPYFPLDKIQVCGDIYCDLLLNSKFFKHSLATQKNIQQAISLFIGHDLVEEKSWGLNKLELFTNHVLSFKAYDASNLEFKLQKQNNFKIMGKYFVTAEEQIIVNQILEESFKKPTIKKKI